MGSSGAREARRRSARMGSLLPKMLRGKSPCFMAESASGRPPGYNAGLCGEAIGGSAMPGLRHLHQHRYVVSARKGVPTERGSLSDCLRNNGSAICLLAVDGNEHERAWKGLYSRIWAIACSCPPECLFWRGPTSQGSRIR